ncbi:MAG TPA: D-glycerate dehydrogenase [Gemmataceae bacterium]|jgi:glyoxylate reductase|nr:D-glycerate dehydrogenase [Gemmataceae bacterium]
MSKPKVFVTRRIPEAGLSRIRAACDAEVWPDQLPPPYDLIKRKLADCDGLVSLLTDRIDGELLDAGPRLKVVSNFAVGFNNIDVPAATARGVCVGNTPGALTDATADCAFMLLIAAARRLAEGLLDARECRWKTWEPVGYLGQDLHSKTLGVVGMGRIGSALAKRCHAGWGMFVLYYDLAPNPHVEAELGARRVGLEELLRASDFVSVHAALTPENRHLIGAAQFRLMKPTAVFVNTARGPLVDQKALYEALKSGTIFAAGLDVTDPEPPAADDPLLRLPNAIIMPHIASATCSTRDDMAEICADNLIAGVTDQPLRAWVNPEVAEKRRGG